MTNILTTSPNITGNVGSCAITSTDIKVNAFSTETVAFNSCTGGIVTQNTYIEYGKIGAILVLIFLIVLIGLFFKMIYKNMFDTR